MIVLVQMSDGNFTDVQINKSAQKHRKKKIFFKLKMFLTNPDILCLQLEYQGDYENKKNICDLKTVCCESHF